MGVFGYRLLMYDYFCSLSQIVVGTMSVFPGIQVLC